MDPEPRPDLQQGGQDRQVQGQNPGDVLQGPGGDRGRRAFGSGHRHQAHQHQPEVLRHFQVQQQEIVEAQRQEDGLHRQVRSGPGGECE